MARSVVFTLSFVATLLSFGATALACGPCEYKDSLGLCLPKGGCLIPKVGDVLAAPLNLAKALTSGNPDEIKTALGNALVNSAGCIGCEYVATKIAPKLSDEQRKRIIGEGFLVFLATGDPVLVVIDVATNLATQHPIATDPNLPSAPVPPQRGKKSYSSEATCIIQKGTQIYGAWISAPILRESATGQDSTFPIVDLLSGDTLNLKARDCSEQNDPSSGQIALTSATIRYERSSTIPGGPTQWKYFLIGASTPTAPAAAK